MANSLDVSPYYYQQTRVIETEHGFLLSGNYYRKDDLTPISQIGTKIEAYGGKNMLCLKTHMNLNTTVRSGIRHNDFGIVPDPYIENRYYILLNGHHSNVSTKSNYSTIIVIEDSGKDITVIKTISDTDVLHIEEIYSITEDYIFFLARNLRYGSTIYYCRVINKKTWTISNIISNDTRDSVWRTKPKKVYEDETYLYIGYRYYHIYYVITEIDKSNLTYKSKGRAVKARNLYRLDGSLYASVHYDTGLPWVIDSGTVIHDNLYEEDGKYYFPLPYRNGAGSDPEKYLESTVEDNMIAFCFDTNINFDEDEVLTEIRIPHQRNTELIWYKDNVYSTFRFWVVDDYLYYALYDENQISSVNLLSTQGIHCFKILTGFDLEWQNVIRPSSSDRIISMILNSDRSICIIGYWQKFEILKRNTETGAYEQMHKVISSVENAGFDALDRLWYQKINGEIHVQNLDDPITVDMHFERSYYTYEDSDISSYITFEAYNFLNEAAAGKYILTLEGNAKFTLTGNKTFEFIYSGGTTQINITVTGPERITCNTKFIKVW